MYSNEIDFYTIKEDRLLRMAVMTTKNLAPKESYTLKDLFRTYEWNRVPEDVKERLERIYDIFAENTGWISSKSSDEQGKKIYRIADDYLGEYDDEVISSVLDLDEVYASNDRIAEGEIFRKEGRELISAIMSAAIDSTFTLKNGEEFMPRDLFRGVEYNRMDEQCRKLLDEEFLRYITQKSYRIKLKDEEKGVFSFV